MAGPEHDQSYKRFFSFPEMVEDLFRDLVKQPWIADVDFSTLEPVKASFVSDDFREREDDVIWRVRYKGRWLYIYILLEFQSTVDKFMALRIMIYIGLLYQDLIKNDQLTEDGLLPPVFPIVLYNGEDRWTAAPNVSELIEPLPGLEEWRPECWYYLLAERDYTDEELAPLKNLVAALFRLELSRSREDIVRVLRLLVEWLREPGLEELRRTFAAWIRQKLLPRRVPDVPVPEVTELEEMTSMLEQRVKEWTHGWVEEGRQAGEAALLARLLEKRFGPLSEEQRKQIARADAETLLLWGDNFVTAERVEDVFA